MGSFLSCFLQIILLTCLPPLLLGLCAWGGRKLYFLFVGEYPGNPMIIATSALSTPLREGGHALLAIAFWHRIEEICLLDLHNPDGEYGFVEHSYNPRNPISVLGNFFYAFGPVIVGMFAVMVIFLTCFRGVLSPFFSEIAALGEAGAGIAAYVKTTLSFLPSLFTGGEGGWLGKVIGCVLLLSVCLGIHVSPEDAFGAISGFIIYAVLAAVTSGVLCLFDSRVMRIALSALRSFAAAVTAMLLVVLAFVAVLVIIGFFYGLFRGLLAPHRANYPMERK